jgi:hypothetical protein
MAYRYFEGEWERVPDFDSLEPVKRGVTSGFDFGPRDDEERFGLCYEGFVEVPSDGMYRFSTVSDDGSRLYIWDELIVDNDGLHVAVEKSGVIPLAAGVHPIRVEFFERTGEDVLEVWYQGPGLEKRLVTGDVLFHR